MEKTSKATSHASEIRDIYQEVTDKIIGLLEKGVAPWRSTWNTYGLARNYFTGHIYSGINYILMNNTIHPIPYFLTFKQIKELGGKIRKGTTAEMVVYYNVYYKDSSDWTISKEEADMRRESGEEIQVLKFIKYYNVFNIADIEGIEFKFKEIKLTPHKRIASCEKIIKQMPLRPEVMIIDSNAAFYSSSLDIVNMPAIEQFETPESYYAVFFHELVHSTGHVSRLAREEVMNVQTFGRVPYCMEELLAEMGASYLCSISDIDFNIVGENSASYLAGWLKVLKEDNRFIFKVAAQAQRAVDYILNGNK